VITKAGPKPNLSCKFPSKFRGIWHSKCIQAEEFPDRSWCSTKVDKTRKHLQGNWGDREGIEEDTKCGIATPLLPTIKRRIVEGFPAFPQQFPFAVLLGYKQNEQITFSCGGALIGKRFVLTAAHCFHTNKPTVVRLGEQNISTDPDCAELNKCAPDHQDIKIEKITVHKNYEQNPFFVNDIALIKLAKPAIINPGVQVVCMPSLAGSLSASLVGKTPTVVGWGRTDPFSNGYLSVFGVASPVLQYVEVPIVNQQRCRDTFRSQISDQKQICAGGQRGDSCSGDSGGPLMYRSDENEPWTLIGIVSYGNTRCGSQAPAVYTNVGYYMDWIKRTKRL